MSNDKKPVPAISWAEWLEIVQQDEAAKKDPAYQAAYDHHRGLYDERDTLLAMPHKAEKTRKRLGEIADELMELEKSASLIPEIQAAYGKPHMPGPEGNDETFTVRGVHGHSTMNRPAFEDYQERLNSRRAQGRYTLEEAALALGGAGARADDMLEKFERAALDHSIPVYEPGMDARWRYGHGFASHVRHSYEEARWDELNQWLADNDSHIKFRFPPPSGTTVKAAMSAPGVARAAVQRTRTDGLATAMGAGLIAYRVKYRIDPTARALFDWLATNDETGKIEDFNSDTDVITWKRSDGGLSDTSFKSFQGRFTSMKK